MADTRLSAPAGPFFEGKDYEIGAQARFVWQRYSDQSDPLYGGSCATSPRRVLGWSTGALAAYKLAHEGWGDGYVLIAPGLVPKLCVGQSVNNCMANLRTNKVITEETLTTNTFPPGSDPHVDPIRPASPDEAK